MSKSIKLPHFVVREVRRAVFSAKLAMHLCRCAVERGDLGSARQYRIEAREYLALARVNAELYLKSGDSSSLSVYSGLLVFPKLPSDKPAEIAKDESATEQVSVPAASPRLSVCSVQDGGYFKVTQKFHPNKWSPWTLYLQARDGLFPCWPPLFGKRSLVGGQGEVCLPSI